MRRVALRWAPAITMMAIIFTLSSIPKGTIIPDFDVWDFVIKKSAHLCGYALLAVAYLWGLVGGGTADRRRLLCALILAAAYGLSDEAHQRFVPGREGSLQDVAIDALGAAIGLFVWALHRRGVMEEAAPVHLSE